MDSQWFLIYLASTTWDWYGISVLYSPCELREREYHDAKLDAVRRLRLVMWEVEQVVMFEIFVSMYCALLLIPMPDIVQVV